jgi:hypothetical protein
MKVIDSSLPPVTHIWVTLSGFFLHISPLKGHKGWLLGNMLEIIITLDKIHKD